MQRKNNCEGVRVVAVILICVLGLVCIWLFRVDKFVGWFQGNELSRGPNERQGASQLDGKSASLIYPEEKQLSF
jgi:hypothetical protein